MARSDLSEDVLRRLDLNLLVMFDAVMRLGSVSRAAQSLDVTQSAVSHALGKLRDFFGDPLFVRSGKGIVPTSKAQHMGETVSAVIALLRGPLLTEAVFDPALTARTISLYLNDFGEFVTLPLFAAHVRRAAPLCSMRVVQMQGAELEEGLESGAVDLAVSGPAAFSGDILQQRLYLTDFAVVAAAGASFREPLSLEDYAAIDQVCVRPARPDKLPIDPMLENLGVARREAISTPHTMTVPAILGANPEMIATVPRLLAHNLRHAGRLRILSTRFRFPEVSVLQYWHRRFHSSSFNMWLRGAMRQSMASAYGPHAPGMNDTHISHDQDPAVGQTAAG